MTGIHANTREGTSMSPSPSPVPTIAPARAIMLPASFAACAVLVLILYVALVGCGQQLFLGDPADTVNPNARNAILCSCECDGVVDNAVPSSNTIRAKEDDVVQLAGQATADPFTDTLGLGFGAHVGLRFEKIGLPPNADV